MVCSFLALQTIFLRHEITYAIFYERFGAFSSDPHGHTSFEIFINFFWIQNLQNFSSLESASKSSKSLFCEIHCQLNAMRSVPLTDLEFDS